MSKREIVTCDRCGAENIGPKREVYVPVDEEPDNGYPLYIYREMHLCPSCTDVELSTYVVMLDPQRGRDFAARIEREMARAYDRQVRDCVMEDCATCQAQ